MKTLDKEQRKSLQQADPPAKAKRLGRRVSLGSDGEPAKFSILSELLYPKFSRPNLRQKLLDTGEAEMIEGNTWGDRVWGCVLVKGQGVGKNHLGKSLMQVRSDRRQEQGQALSKVW